MRLSEASRIVLCALVVVAALLVVDSPLVAAMPEPICTEAIMITVNCSDSSVMTMLVVSSDNDTLINFPDPVDLNDPHLSNGMIVASSSPAVSMLAYVFQGINETQARENADAITPSMETAFGVSFTWDSTETIDTAVYVNYTGPGQSDMISFANSMVSECVHPDVKGFSYAIQSLATRTTTSSLTLTAMKAGVDWLIGIGAMSNSNIPTGSGSHTIDVFDLLGVYALAPSPYSFNATEDYYQSIVWLTINPDTPISFVDCRPPEKEHPEDLSERGWTHMFPMFEMAMFYFGNESTSPESLTFTFSGTVVPEFTPPTIVITLILTAACMIAFKKRIQRKNCSHAPLF